MVMFRFIQWLCEGRTVYVNGDGEQTRGFTFVDDIARGTILGLKPVGYQIINLGGHETVSINELLTELENRIAHLRAAIVNTPAVGDDDRDRLQQLSTQLADITIAINGDSTVAGRNEPAPVSISSRVEALYSSLVYTQSAAGGNYSNSYDIASREFVVALQS